MSVETKSMHLTPVSGNVFADLGFEPAEAAVLKAQSQRVIAEKLAIKDSMIVAQAEWFGMKELKRVEADSQSILDDLSDQG